MNLVRYHCCCSCYVSFKCTKFVTFHFKALSTHAPPPRSQIKCLNKALSFLDLIKSPKPTTIDRREIHRRLIDYFLQAHRGQYVNPPSTDNDDSDFSFSSSKPRNPFERRLFKSSIFKKDDAISMLFEQYRQGLTVDAAVASNAFSACGSARSLYFGVQLHSLVIRIGISVKVYVGSSLVGFYSKCGELSSACKVFEEMPERNVVSWTALISGFAREWKVDACLELYSWMRNSMLEPNEFTFTTILSACMGTGSVGKARSAHRQTIHFGFDSHVHVANALISTYCKCGNVCDAFSVFEGMHNKDIVSWNSMIAGYALHGLAMEAIGLFEEMSTRKIKPDAITFLGVLSSCRHAGLVDRGRLYFNLMVENGVKLDLDHYSCFVDLLGRAGLLKEARDFILEMPMQPNAIVWGTLLSSCRLHSNVWIGIEAAESRLALEPGCAATHVQLAHLYARAGLWDQAARVRKMMKCGELKTNPGYSWIEIGREVYQFKAEDTFNLRMDEILVILDILKDHLAAPDFAPELHEDIDSNLCAIV
ncbi:Pentatricopeptide repeat-containing protein At2g37320, variant 2 [Ancistrocladus abbreviatus]